MAKITCDSIWMNWLDFPQGLRPNDQFLLCGLSVVEGKEDVQSPDTKISIEEAHVTVWDMYENGQRIPYMGNNLTKFKAWPIVVGKPKPDDNNNTGMLPGTYLLVYGICGDQIPAKMCISYTWTYERVEYRTYEEIINYPPYRRPDTRLAELEFKIRSRNFLQRLRDAARTDEEADEGWEDGSWEWKEIVDEFLAGTTQGLHPSWCSVVESSCPEQSVLLR